MNRSLVCRTIKAVANAPRPIFSGTRAPMGVCWKFWKYDGLPGSSGWPGICSDMGVILGFRARRPVTNRALCGLVSQILPQPPQVCKHGEFPFPRGNPPFAHAFGQYTIVCFRLRNDSLRFA